MIIDGSDLEWASGQVRPSALRESVVEVPSVLWSDIGGQEEAKKAIEEAVEWPLKYAAQFQQLGIRPPAGLFFRARGFICYLVGSSLIKLLVAHVVGVITAQHLKLSIAVALCHNPPPTQRLTSV